MDFGFAELMIIGIVALIVVGPKDLPHLFKQLGKFTAKIRRMAREFSRAMEDAADESGMKDTASSLKKMTSARELGLDAVRDAAKNWDPTKPSEAAKKIGPETAKLSEERAEAAKKIHEYSAKKTQERIDKEAAAAEAAETSTEAEPPAAKSGET
ncbi:MAG: Sec-independent protein translocase protein TatB [Pseudomonadota bacterium]